MSNARELAELSGSYGTGGFVGMKNRIINGAMMIDQRNSGASVTPITGQYLVDRWQYISTQASKLTAQQNYGTVTPPVGYTNYLGFQSSSAYSIVAGDYFGVRQQVEGFNAADFSWGTASAQPVTLSFWVRSSLTGTFGGSFGNATLGRTYPFSYVINAANTWEQKTITVSGDTSGTWGTGSGIGVGINFSMGTGSTSSGTAGSWSSSAYLSATGATSVVGTSGATFYITGVQLEKGTQATSFDFRPYGAELALCQRYYIKKTGVDGDNFNIGQVASATRGLFWEPWVMRSAPTINYANIVLNDVAVGPTVTGTAGITTFSSGISYALDAAGGGMTSGRACRIRSSASGYIDFSAEL